MSEFSALQRIKANHREISLHPKSNSKETSVGEGVEKRKPLHTVGKDEN